MRSIPKLDLVAIALARARRYSDDKMLLKILGIKNVNQRVTCEVMAAYQTSVHENADVPA